MPFYSTCTIAVRHTRASAQLYLVPSGFVVESPYNCSSSWDAIMEAVRRACVRLPSSAVAREASLRIDSGQQCLSRLQVRPRSQ